MSMKKLVIFATALLATTTIVRGVTRVYYVAIKEIEWDYAPSGINLINNIPLEDDEEAAVFTVSTNNTIGRKYKKAVYRQYEDPEFTNKSPRNTNWGIIGPPLRAEVGDKFEVHVRNFASRHYSMHPHGVFYNKTNEGAVYIDNTTRKDKVDDKIPPGEAYTYHWKVTEEFSPTKEDPDCMTWAYHSHILSHRDTNTGLIGPILICKPGSLNENGKRSDVDDEILLLFTVFDENESWYLDDNIKTYTLDPDSVDLDDEDFQENNKMHAINGLVYRNLPDLLACKGDKIGLHIFGIGTEIDIHSVHFKGQTIEHQGHRTDTIQIVPGIFTTAIMNADDPGVFDISCKVNDHYIAGMSAKFVVNQCENNKEQQNVDDVTETIRKFFIGINEVDWNYGPGGWDFGNKQNLTTENSHSATFFVQGPDRIGGTYRKAIYTEFESAEFRVEKPKPKSHGLLGPIIGVEVGDVVQVTLKNCAQKQAYNIEPHGVFFHDVSPIEPGETHTYDWTVPDSVSPTKLDSDCVAYIYTSTVDPIKDALSGLAGPMLVCKRGTLERNLERRAIYLLFSVFDENLSHYLEENIQQFTTDPDSIDREDGDFIESNLMHAINGRMYGNLNVTLCRYAETDIHILGLGTEVNMHAFYMDGLVYTFRNEWTDVLIVLPHTTASTTVKPQELGKGKIICGVFDHYSGGMQTPYSVTDCGLESDNKEAPLDDVIRTYYVAAVEQIWDYLPRNKSKTNHDLSPFTEQKTGKFIGTKYWKALYQEYTDDTFTRRKKKLPYLGFLGPVLSAEEGDKIKVVFKNMASRDYNMVPNGLIPENFLAEGIIAAAPGDTVTYVWDVPKLAVPSQNQPDCNGHVYVSKVNVIEDIYSGLIGPIIICRKGGLSSDGWMRKADAEFVLLFFVSDENNGHYLDRNIRDFAEADPETFNKDDDEFVESNLMHGINGQLDHVEGLTMHDGDRVIWHLIGMGNEVDIHSVHFHAHAYNYTSDRLHHEDVFLLFQGVTGTVDMRVNDVGSWLVHCHINDHMTAGMSSTYTVLPKKSKPIKHPSCYASQSFQGIRAYKLHCIFEDTRSLQHLIDHSGEGLEVCMTSLKKDIFSCENVEKITLSHVYLLNVSTNFDMEATSFQKLLSDFKEVRFVYANDIGLKFILPNTFYNNRLMLRIYLRRNKIETIPAVIFDNLFRLRFADFRYNNLNESMRSFSIISPGVNPIINFRHNHN